jgi:hypothetical protein
LSFKSNRPGYRLDKTYVQFDHLDDAEWQLTELENLILDSKISQWQDIVVITDENLRKRLFADLRNAGMAE